MRTRALAVAFLSLRFTSWLRAGSSLRSQQGRFGLQIVGESKAQPALLLPREDKDDVSEKVATDVFAPLPSYAAGETWVADSRQNKTEISLILPRARGSI